MTADELRNPDPRPPVSVSKNGDPTKLGVHLYERLKNGPRGPALDLVAIGPLAVNVAIRGVIEANSRLARAGVYIHLIPTTKKMERRPDSRDAYGDANATVLVVSLQDME